MWGDWPQDTSPKNPLDLPYNPKTPQVEGREAEKKLAKEHGVRLHPNSGAGKIKWDASSDEKLTEFKVVGSSHTLNGKYLNSLYKRALVLGKEPSYVITFTTDMLEVECRIRRISPSS